MNSTLREDADAVKGDFLTRTRVEHRLHLAEAELDIIDGAFQQQPAVMQKSHAVTEILELPQVVGRNDDRHMIFEA